MMDLLIGYFFGAVCSASKIHCYANSSLFFLIFDEFLASYRTEAVPNKVQNTFLLLLSCAITMGHCGACRGATTPMRLSVISNF